MADAGDPPSLPFLPDEILGDIFLRLEAAEDLARVSAACKSYRRVVCDPKFLRRFRFLHPPPVLGFFGWSEGGRFRHAEPPHRCASAARALAGAADFTWSFLPDPDSWEIRDASDGRLLLCSRTTITTGTTTGSIDLVVCDPLHRRYVRIPPIPDDLATRCSWSGPLFFLAPSGEEGSPLRVICLERQMGRKLSAVVFSSDIWKWRGVTFNGCWGYCTFMLTSCRDFAQRSLYWPSGAFIDVLMLNARKMEFSVVRVPLANQPKQRTIVEAGEGRLGLLTLGDGDGILDFYCKAWQDNGVGSEKWQHKKTIPLPDSVEYTFTFCGAGDGYILLQATPRGHANSSQHMAGIQYFTLEVKTLLVERLCVLDKCIDFAHLYANFLPPLSLPVV